jgi:predicted Zn-ribbon and HTH transcriptional regulator
MSALGTLLERVFGSEIVLHECRNCGTTLDSEDARCPECDSADVATYRFSQ